MDETLDAGRHLEEIRARCEAATSGPWTQEPDRLANDAPTRWITNRWDYDDDDAIQLVILVEDHPGAVTDATFIAHARADVPWLLDQVFALRARLEAAEALHEPIPDTYACEACGRRDGLDAVLPSSIWEQIRDGMNLLCLWCIDRRCRDAGIKARASLHFAGEAVSGTSDSDANAEHVSRLVQQRIAAEARAEGLAYWLKAYRGVIGSNAWRNGNLGEIDAIDAALAEHDAAVKGKR